ncbi:MAG: tetratricopeptide repeat protein [Planctomycetota bacterium]|nr:tetratricopeptide repeat protein [Planctomycetota bacterium]
MMQVALISAQLVFGQATEPQSQEITLPELPAVETTEPIVQPDRQLTEQSLEELLDQARRSLEGNRYPEAVELYTEVSDRLPGDQRVQYNRGVAAYRAGDLESAARAFDRAAGSADQELTQAALFNRGTVSYRAALDAIRQAQARQSAQQAEGGTPDPGVLQEPIEALNQAIGHYRDAITASSNHRDARRNAELAYRLLKELQQQQDQQEQDQQEQDPQEQDPQEQDPQEQDPQEQDSQGQDPQEQDSQGQDPQGQDPQGQDPQEQDSQGQDQPQAGEPGSGTEQPEARLSDEQAEALLQMIRDKEKQRRQVLAERAAREAARRYRPVERDW